MAMPEWAKSVKPGNTLTVLPEMMGRGGQTGTVVEEGITDEGVALDFFTSNIPGEYITIEFYEWGELESPWVTPNVELSGAASSRPTRTAGSAVANRMNWFSMRGGGNEQLYRAGIFYAPTLSFY